MNLLIDDIKTFREFNIKNSSVCRFSCGGHLLAAVSAKDIHVYSSINFQKVVRISFLLTFSAVVQLNAMRRIINWCRVRSREKENFTTLL